MKHLGVFRLLKVKEMINSAFITHDKFIPIKRNLTFYLKTIKANNLRFSMLCSHYLGIFSEIFKGLYNELNKLVKFIRFCQRYLVILVTNAMPKLV